MRSLAIESSFEGIFGTPLIYKESKNVTSISYMELQQLTAFTVTRLNNISGNATEVAYPICRVGMDLVHNQVGGPNNREIRCQRGTGGSSWYCRLSGARTSSILASGISRNTPGLKVTCLVDNYQSLYSRFYPNIDTMLSNTMTLVNTPSGYPVNSVDLANNSVVEDNLASIIYGYELSVDKIKEIMRYLAMRYAN